MISGRAYSKAKTQKAAFEEIIRCSGTQFDKEIALKFIEALSE